MPALVIGNAKYATMSELMNDALRAKLHDELHFETIVRIDLTRDGYNSALSDFVRVTSGDLSRPIHLEGFLVRTQPLYPVLVL
jgi:hypothetical protein